MESWQCHVSVKQNKINPIEKWKARNRSSFPDKHRLSRSPAKDEDEWCAELSVWSPVMKWLYSSGYRVCAVSLAPWHIQNISVAICLFNRLLHSVFWHHMRRCVTLCPSQSKKEAPFSFQTSSFQNHISHFFCCQLGHESMLYFQSHVYFGPPY